MVFSFKSSEGVQQPHATQRFDSQTLSDSASDFQKIVWPRITNLSLVGGGELCPVEAVSDTNFKDALDLLAGIDAWQIQKSPSAVRGIASRVQWGASRRTFTLRTRSSGGGETELDKRARAISNQANGHIYPHLTVQAYLDAKAGNLQCVAVVKTEDLIARAIFLRENMKYQTNWYGYQANSDGSEFMYIHWDYLKSKGDTLDVI